MSEVACVRVKLKPNTESQVQAWAEYMRAHQSEARATLGPEGVEIESVFLDPQADGGNDLVIYMRAESLARAASVAAKSEEAVDAFHQAFKRETWADVVKLELLLDLAR